MPVDLQTRRLRYFVVLAEELHFTKAAERLFLRQQSLSDQIRRLEATVGVQLVDRTTRSVNLTPAGQEFLKGARAILVVLDEAVELSRAMDREARSSLAIGFMVSAAYELTGPITSEFGRRFPQVKIDFHDFDYSDPSVGLTEGSVDIGFVREPIQLKDLEYAELFVEPRVLCVSSQHPLADRGSVAVNEILDEEMVSPGGPDSGWNSFWMLDEYRQGKQPQVAFRTSTLLEEMEAISLGAPYVMVTVKGAERYIPRPGIRFVPIEGISGSTVSLAWRKDRTTPLIRAFVETALEVRDQEVELMKTLQQTA